MGTRLSVTDGQLGCAVEPMPGEVHGTTGLTLVRHAPDGTEERFDLPAGHDPGRHVLPKDLKVGDTLVFRRGVRVSSGVVSALEEHLVEIELGAVALPKPLSPRCGYCKDHPEPAERFVCQDCLTIYHRLCWLSDGMKGRCADCGGLIALTPLPAAVVAAPALPPPAVTDHPGVTG